MEEVKISTAGDSALLIEFGQEISPEINARITAFVHLLKAQRIEGVQDMIPAFTSLLINYDPRVVNYKTLTKRLQKLLKLDVNEETSTSRVFEIPVCYGGEYGPDIENIAKNAGLTEEEVIKIHSSKDYLIYMLGFLPGFSYLGGLDERIHTPRLANPRIRIPAGSVGIGGSQTGIYPLDSPGGWQLLGLTPVKTYDPERENPILFEAGDYALLKSNGARRFFQPHPGQDRSGVDNGFRLLSKSRPLVKFLLRNKRWVLKPPCTEQHPRNAPYRASFEV